MSFCDSCLYPTAIASCDSTVDCDALSVCGLFNQTAVTSQIPNRDSTLYVWRLLVSNCSGHKFCNVTLALELKWKLSGNGIYQNEWWFNPVADANRAHYEIQHNIPGAIQRTIPFAWRGTPPTGDDLFIAPFTLPPGQFVVQVSLEIANSLIPTGDCPAPVLFPATAVLTGSDATHGNCPFTVSALIGCHPATVIIDDLTPPSSP